ncbi:enhancer of mRNA-decapping protein 4 isoform X2 [Pararge aegeria]|uniref:enhancer of mRNA-decapping protein 4 isoform X2 n=1 Tax=Pararge aegeria TaxID=116150 RepID=UPI0019D11986|nr:enhancer of mRNA-decapping protein 4 isoform X2 [Pararge aegeria]
MQPTAMLPKLSETTQTISFSEDDETCSSEVYASNVVVTTNPGNHNHGSSKMKLKTMVDYHWQPKFYPGQLLAIHISGNFLAYSIIAPIGANSGTSKTPNGMVRVVYKPKPGVEQRALIKGMKGEVQDLAFAHIQNQVVLASIDEMGNFYIHEIEVNESGFSVTATAEVREDTGVGGNTHRVVWCPYIPDEDDAPDDDVARLLLTTHANQARMWNVRAVEAACGGGGWVSAGAALHTGAGRGAGTHGGAVMAAAFSPDGTALATAAADGYVMFAQVYMNNESSPRCLHKWQPHDGKPLSSLFFLDNHKNYLTDVQFWKFAVTGAENNTSIKIWSCKSWSCLQSVSFQAAPGAACLGMNAMLDSSANYLLLSDFSARSLYVLGMARDGEDSMAYCKSISQFLLRYPVLSFCIVDAEEQQGKCESSCNDPFHRNGSGGEADSPDDFDLNNEDGNGSAGGGGARVRVRLYIVHPTNLQEAELVYEPPAPADRVLPLHDLEELTLEDGEAEAPGALPSSIIQQQTQQLKNLLMRSQTQPGSLMGPRPESPSSLPPPLNLMTPDAFSSPGKREDDDPPLSATPDISNKSILSGGLNEEVPLGPENKASGGSSPSREVQEIMGHNDQPFFTDMEVEDATKQDTSQETEAATETVAPVTDSLVPTGQFFSADLFNSPEKPPPPAKLTHANSDTSWPAISLAQITEANQRKASSEKSSTQSLSAPLIPLVVPSAPPVSDVVVSVPERYVIDEDTKLRLQSLEEKLDNLTELMTAQARSLATVRSEMQAPRSLLDESLQRTADTIDTALSAGWERIARVGEAASAAAATAAGSGAARALEPLAHALQHELAAKLSATDRLLRDNIDKLASSKTIMERLSTAIAKSLSEMVRDSFREALFESVVPVMEKAHAQIFRQINHAFQNGTKEFAANTEAAARAAAERGGAAAAASLRSALERHADALAQAAPHNPQVFAAQIKDVVHGVLEKEVSWWREQTRAAVQQSRAQSPAHNAPSVADRQMQVSQIQSLMMSGDVNGAFQLALSASDLTLVVAACRAAEPGRVFGPPCRLKQHVLLSLVQQLAADMAKDTHLKHRYLEEAIMNLDTSNPMTREHLPGVVRELQKQIVAFLGNNSGHALSRQFRMLLMATEALVKSTA